ncbi:MAG: hypothetical protein CMG13_04665 [Candidatus Marinimicrobia bacterium]|nr:hypothetical protein [Candidatus Neomarinimicrobiota bacterium]|tara:strand:- start:14263 stop:15681 length:1419 start_codon:yes stop_codon:yes gene_type:complete
MFKKLLKITILLAISLSTVFASSELFMKKKIQIEDGFRGMGWDPDLYKIWIGTRHDANIDSKYKIRKKTSKGTQKQYIPGLPTIPSAPKTVSTPSSSYNESYIVYIYIDSSYDNPSVKNSMEKMIKADIWPSLNHCDDCVQFETLDFYRRGSKKGENPSSEAGLTAAEDAAKALEARLIELQDANIALERTNELNQYQIEEQEKTLLEQEFADLEEQLKELQNQSFEKEDKLEDMKSFRMSYLEEQYKMQMMFKDSLLSRYGQKLDNIYDRKEGCLDKRADNYDPDANAACENCCSYPEGSVLSIAGCMDPDALNYNKRFTKDCEDCCRYLGCMDPDALNYNSLATEEGSCEYQESNLMMIILIVLVSILIVLSTVAILGNKKKVVYLKPKEDSSQGGEKSVPAAPVPAPAPAPAPVAVQTSAPLDEGVLQAEIQSQRQSAIAMSAGQKEGATQILKDWLDESKKDEENSEE